MNRTIPASRKSRFPEHRLPQDVTAPANVASVEEPPAGQATGFEAGVSLEQVDRRGAYVQVFSNVDGTETSVFRRRG